MNAFTTVCPYGAGGLGLSNIANIEVTPKQIPGLIDVRGTLLQKRLLADEGLDFSLIRSIIGYQVKTTISYEEISHSVNDLFADPIIEHGVMNESLLNDLEIFQTPPELAIMVGFKPGVTDNAAQAGLDGFNTIFPSTHYI